MLKLVTDLTLTILILAVLVFVFQVVRQRIAGQLSAWSFSTVFLVMLIGWMLTEVVREASGASVGQTGEVGHFLIMILFAAVMTLQLRRSSEE